MHLQDRTLREIDTFLTRDTTLSPVAAARYRRRLAEADQALRYVPPPVDAPSVPAPVSAPPRPRTHSA